MSTGFDAVGRPRNEAICTCSHTGLQHGSHGRCEFTKNGRRCRCEQFVHLAGSEWLEGVNREELVKALAESGQFIVKHGGNTYTIECKPKLVYLQFEGWHVSVYTCGKKLFTITIPHKTVLSEGVQTPRQ
jgi:hypothetical protein